MARRDASLSSCGLAKRGIDPPDHRTDVTGTPKFDGATITMRSAKPRNCRFPISSPAMIVLPALAASASSERHRAVGTSPSNWRGHGPTRETDSPKYWSNSQANPERVRLQSQVQPRTVAVVAQAALKHHQSGRNQWK